MRLFDATLDLARYARGIETHTISHADPMRREITLMTMKALPREFSGGTIWFNTGSSKGKVTPIESAIGQKIILRDNLENGYSIGDEVSIAPWTDWNYEELKNAINNVLAHYPIMRTADFTDVSYEYELPEEIMDVRRIERLTKDKGYKVCHYWDVSGRTLKFQYGRGAKIRVHYVTDHGAVNEYERIDSTVDAEYLRKIAALNLWRNEVITKHKDNVIAAEMFNEAKNYEAETKKNNTLLNRLPPRDRTYAW